MLPNNLQKYAEPTRVLDHGFVRLVDVMGNDQAITSAARCSTGKNEKEYSEKKDRKLIRYMYRNGHTSPFEMCEIKLHCKMPIFVARQWIRHRTASVNEFSGRYSKMPDEMYVPETWKGQDSDNKQGSAEEVGGLRLQEYLTCAAESIHQHTREIYEERLEYGVSKEQARVDLPLSQYTEWYWKIDLHNLFNFLAQRLHTHAQWEIRQYAEVISDIVADWVPLAWEAFLDYRLGSKRLSYEEVGVVQNLVRMLRGTLGNDELLNAVIKEADLSKREHKELKSWLMV